MMVPKYRTAISVTALMVLVTAASLTESVAQGAMKPATGVAEFVADRQGKARQLEAAGDWAGALQQWRYIKAINSGDQTIKSAIAKLEKRIASRARDLLGQAQAQLKKGRNRQARSLYLKVLAVDTSNAEALKQLRRMEERKILAGQNSKDEAALEEYRVSKAATETSNAAAKSSMADLVLSYNNKQYKRAVSLAQVQLKAKPRDTKAGNYASFTGIQDDVIANFIGSVGND